ncbi:MAG TPA: hypothetical protein VMV89_10725 [Candidatus Paceibacterota bacterium]|nr:hypothetical protein [Candidatus Paceibacterota bacterium]
MCQRASVGADASASDLRAGGGNKKPGWKLQSNRVSRSPRMKAQRRHHQLFFCRERRGKLFSVRLGGEQVQAACPQYKTRW